MKLLVKGNLIPDFPEIDDLTDGNYPIAIGGDLSVERLLRAYKRGIFPWFTNDPEIRWWSPDPRVVLFPENFKVSRSFKKSIRNRGYVVTLNQAFEQTMTNCALRPERVYSAQSSNDERRRSATGIINSSDTWITNGMIDAYCELHRCGYAHSLETWLDGQLVGGLYGLGIGRIFFGESMFSIRTDASKVALFNLMQHLVYWKFRVIDCQLPSMLFLSLGARSVKRKEFLDIVKMGVQEEIPIEAWQCLSRAG